MVLQKRLDYGSSGHQVPVMPHVPRSAKGKRSVRKKVEDHPMCAFDLLATVAGKLLERENHATSFSRIETSSPIPTKNSVKPEEFYKETPLKTEAFDHRSSNKITNDSGKPIISGTLGELGYTLVTIPEKFSTERHSPTSMESQECKIECKIEDGVKTPLQPERRTAGNLMDGNLPGVCSSDDPMDLDSKPPALVSSDSSPPSRDSIAGNGSFPKTRNDTELVADGDDDENSSGCTHPSTMTSKSSGPQRIADRRIRKLMAAKYWKVAPTMFKDGELSDTEMKPVTRSRKICYTRQRTQRCSFKRRKLHEHSRGMCSEGTSNSPVKVEASDSRTNLHGASASLSSTRCQTSSSESDDFYVKFSINSFKVPELFIEMPKTATVGSLKRTVMEAVTAILGNGLRVGVLHQGKKVRDDSKTLFQAGISHGDKLDNMGFTLEPNQAQTPPVIPEDPQFLLPCDATEQLTRIPAVIPLPEQEAVLTPPPPLTSGESDHEAPSLDPTTENSKALVPVPPVSFDNLAMVTLRKSRRSELVQRRIRRPFSVSEVEALVQAVEKLGTGRWRDVKLRAFDNAKHRTYVDLKDKWKTLVHTARISPQQRRGEPVPQELLDRVLAAHAHWTHLPVKPQPSATASDSCLLV